MNNDLITRLDEALDKLREEEDAFESLQGSVMHIAKDIEWRKSLLRDCRAALLSPPKVSDAMREIASWLDAESPDFCGGPSYHEAEIIGMDVSGLIDSSDARHCMKVARKVLLVSAGVWDQHVLSGTKRLL